MAKKVSTPNVLQAKRTSEALPAEEEARIVRPNMLVAGITGLEDYRCRLDAPRKEMAQQISRWHG